ncbi:MAG: ADP-ribosylglycohydrolase family protein [Desulfuromonadales bacterium]|nr:ADP-ribosylglycohydrolase family protein [Desulfuromonadales bacterium]
MMDRNKREHFSGCLLCGAAGDALGQPVEFKDREEITGEYGPDGILEMVPGEEGLYKITDDTQMTLFTAEGLLRAWTTARQSGGVPDFAGAVRHSYLCWLKTQGETPAISYPGTCCDGWLLAVEGMHRRRAPGATCLSALREGTLSDNGIVNNTSKGCGGVMRAAPVGLLAARINTGNSAGTARKAFEIGCATAALTHGHPSGYYPAGVLAAVIATIINGGSIEEGIYISLGLLDGRIGSMETIAAIRSALDLWQLDRFKQSYNSVESLGVGWTGEEAVSIGLYCALAAGEDLVRGLRMAVNHSGDSDSTGAITGNILGALLGEQAIPHDWLNQLELVDVIRQVGNDLFTSYEGTESWLKSYPLMQVSL